MTFQRGWSIPRASSTRVARSIPQSRRSNAVVSLKRWSWGRHDSKAYQRLPIYHFASSCEIFLRSQTAKEWAIRTGLADCALWAL